ncbi:hypothetical protein COCMIDRAFT_9931 [Bipolaris oryzae ATCC 44560]|uniref:Uncharacterized protein n=1 Tax=Bipolaris oryzae ATCC 44560 TaxID=930090 RepID=W6YR75_COCMI|nr:uncharacterized protein COCMIDRAFT_9931 [Bipolaris oryzae ATCC 44560]EUC40135.1 hypothetical protein COCMIDRAFT_9931 [Bipolaris oryzae ATCC 44560]
MTAIPSVATILEYHPLKGIWGLRSLDLLGHNVTLPEVCFIFLKSDDWWQKNCSEENRKKILAEFHAPDILSSNTCAKLNGYCGSSSSFSGDGDESKLDSLSVWFKILTKRVLAKEEMQESEDGKDYRWYEMSFFVRWESSNTRRVLCIGASPKMSATLETMLKVSSLPTFEPQDPLAMLKPLFDETIKLCDENIWAVTRRVRDIELNRKKRCEFDALRNLARHTGHVIEVEQVAIETMEQLLSLQDSNFKFLDELNKTYTVQAREYLLFQLQTMKSLRWRAQSTHDRLEEEINLAYNMLASSDNAVMKSITLLTMIFLPATFISALFSTTFFSFEENGWQFSHMFWIYWVVVIPLTITVVLGWWWWIGGTDEVRWERWLHPKRPL